MVPRLDKMSYLKNRQAKRTKYTCPYCPAYFAVNKNLRTHLRTHNANPYCLWSSSRTYNGFLEEHAQNLYDQNCESRQEIKHDQDNSRERDITFASNMTRISHEDFIQSSDIVIAQELQPACAESSADVVSNSDFVFVGLSCDDVVEESCTGKDNNGGGIARSRVTDAAIVLKRSQDETADSDSDLEIIDISSPCAEDKENISNTKDYATAKAQVNLTAQGDALKLEQEHNSSGIGFETKDHKADLADVNSPERDKNLSHTANRAYVSQSLKEESESNSDKMLISSNKQETSGYGCKRDVKHFRTLNVDGEPPKRLKVSNVQSQDNATKVESDAFVINKVHDSVDVDHVAMSTAEGEGGDFSAREESKQGLTQGRDEILVTSRTSKYHPEVAEKEREEDQEAVTTKLFDEWGALDSNGHTDVGLEPNSTDLMQQKIMGNPFTTPKTARRKTKVPELQQDFLLGFRCRYCLKFCHKFDTYSKHMDRHKKKLLGKYNFKRKTLHGRRIWPSTEDDVDSSTDIDRAVLEETLANTRLCLECGKRCSNKLWFMFYFDTCRCPHVNRCQYCGKYYRNERLLKKHEMSHLSVAPYRCSMCGHKFALRKYYLLHLQVHYEER